MDEVSEHRDWSTGLSQHSVLHVIGRLEETSGTCWEARQLK
jgi:hypothetical protein